ncbi:MAG: potassium transporter TrkG [Arcanobacterium sp.]|nr:potassium transporter TrkG [Arcanobacterium sp.]
MESRFEAESPVLSTQKIFRNKIDALARRSPAQLAMLVFAGIITIITILLLLPISHSGPGGADFHTALFTATSAVSVTGLTIVDTASYWTPFGKVILAIGMQIGGLGVMTLASLLGLAVSRHIGLTQKFLVANETQSRLGELSGLLRAVLITSLTVEALLWGSFLGFFIDDQHSLFEALSHSLFLSISTFNNGGFVIAQSGFTHLVGSWSFGILIMLGTTIGAIGFPVILNLARARTNIRKWALHTKLTLSTFFGLLFLSTLLIALLEWQNTKTLGSLSPGNSFLAALFHATTSRSSGIATIDISQMNESTWFVLDILMFIGGGSAGTGGGIKVTTFAILLLAIISEARGDRDTEVFGKRIPYPVLRLAIAVTFLGAVIVGTATLIIMQITHLPLSQVLFEVISAFATCGLSTGITANLDPASQLILVLLMYLGRVGTMTFAAALALRTRRRVIRLPEDQPIIG